MVVNALVAVTLVWQLAHVGLALATSIAGLANAVLLYRRLKQTGHFTAGQGWTAFLVRVFLATAVMSLVLYVGQGDQREWLEASLAVRVSQLLLWIAIGTALYFSALYLMGLRVHRLLERP